MLAGYTASTVPGVRAEGYNVILEGWVQNGILVGACLLVFVRVATRRSGRLAWASIGTGVGLYAAGNILYFTHVQYLDVVTYPSIADLPWLTSYIFLYLGLIGLARRRIRGADRAMRLDGLVAALGIGAIAAIWLGIVLNETTGSVAAVVTTMAYPVSDLLLLMLILGTSALLGWRGDLAWTYLGIGVALFAAADTIYTLRVATGTYQPGTTLDPLWGIAAVLIAAAALRRVNPNLSASVGHGWAVLVMPSLFTLSSLGVLVYGSLDGVHGVPLLSTVLACAAILAASTRAALTFQDVRRLAISRVEARTDELTGLGNRRKLYETAPIHIEQLAAGEQLAVVLLDLDRFKEINDALGHSAGDALLVQVGERLSSRLRSEDLLVRLGGDEFGLILNATSREQAVAVSERLRQDLQEVFTVQDITINIDVSIGIALCPDAGTTIEALLQRADIAMYGAKQDALVTLVYETGDQDDLAHRLRLIHELRRAIKEGQLVLHYQPLIDLRTEEISGAEALVRWNHPERGLLYPDKFIAEAERYGLMRQLTRAVLSIALDQAQRWQTMGRPTTISVNISASDLLDTQLPDEIQLEMDARGLPPQALMIEVTESTLMVDPTRANVVLQRLNDLGVRISIDDYGTGYSSLARLRDLPVTELKLDRSFVADILTDSRASAIVESTIALAHALGLIIVAEGIETTEAAQLLTRLGCDLGQGYHLNPPVSGAEFTGWLVEAGPGSTGTPSDSVVLLSG